MCHNGGVVLAPANGKLLSTNLLTLQTVTSILLTCAPVFQQPCNRSLSWLPMQIVRFVSIKRHKHKRRCNVIFTYLYCIYFLCVMTVQKVSHCKSKVREDLFNTEIQMSSHSMKRMTVSVVKLSCWYTNTPLLHSVHSCLTFLTGRS